jgi:hypothetical protein
MSTQRILEIIVEEATFIEWANIRIREKPDQ